MYKYTETEFRDAVKQADCKSDVFRILGLSRSGAAYRYVTSKIEQLNIDTQHWYKKTNNTRPRELFEYLVIDGPEISSWKLKQRLWKHGLLPKVCSRCGLTEWFGHDTVLQLDHIDGNPKNNLIENLRILCANCHTLTETWGTKPRPL